MIRARFKFNPRMTEKSIDEVVVVVQQRIALQLLEGVVDMTPVKTGRARGNWQVTIGAPTTTQLQTEDKDGGPTKTAGEAVIQSITTLGAVYLTNNLPYITELEKGTSTQAPQGMVRVTLDRVGAQFR